MQKIIRNSAWMQEALRFGPRVVTLLIVTAVYFVSGRLGLELALVNPSATAVWPPTGIALAAFLILGNYIGIGIMLGALLVNLTISGSIPSSIAIAIGNTLEGLIGAYLVMRFANGRQAFNRAADVFKFTLLAGLLSTAISATIGVSSIVWDGLAQATDYWAIWLTWWLGDAAGSLILAPVIILWATKPKLHWNANRAMEAVFLLASVVLVALAVFGSQSIFAMRHYPLEFLFIPFIIWAAYRFGQRETVTVTLVLSAIAIMGTLQGVGPFIRSEPNESLLLLQSFMMTSTVTGLGLAALASERRNNEAELREVNVKLNSNLDEMEEHNKKMLLLNEMGDLLQSCKTFEEAYAVAGQFGRQLLPEEAGILYIINNSQSTVEAVVTWGTQKTETNMFAFDDCWALRRSRPHVSNTIQDGLELELICPHLKNQIPVYGLCIPMMAQGDAIGILHIRVSSNQGDPVRLTESKQQIAMAIADSIGLAIANLKLRLFLREQSIRDSLTGLFNRHYLDETLEREFHRAMRTQRSVGVIMLDLDHFKHFNDTFSHEAGDILLHNLGGFLKKNLRGGDIACRYGGEEFALILPEASVENVRLRAEQLRDGIKHLTAQYKGKVLSTLTLSLGIAMFPENGETSQQVLSAADAALYTAKREGRDRVVVAPSENANKLPIP
jgi:diguanylate cyclase (GGDEF)-like protein